MLSLQNVHQRTGNGSKFLHFWHGSREVVDPSSMVQTVLQSMPPLHFQNPGSAPEAELTITHTSNMSHAVIRKSLYLTKSINALVNTYKHTVYRYLCQHPQDTQL